MAVPILVFHKVGPIPQDALHTMAPYRIPVHYLHSTSRVRWDLFRLRFVH